MSSEFKDHRIPGLKNNYEQQNKDDLDQIVFSINENKLSKCPEVEIEIRNGITVQAILDSGSEVEFLTS
jgi:hypothetical protein